MAKSKEPWGATIANVIGGAVVLLVGTFLPLQQLASEFSILLRVFFVAMMGLFAWKAWRYYEIWRRGRAPRLLGAGSV
jgi:hypothetical protein